MPSPSTSPSPSPRVIVYHRVSSDGQRERDTIASQRHQTAAIVQRHGLTVLETIEDNGLSGVTLDGRELRGLLERIETGSSGIEGIVIVNASRLIRQDKDSKQSRDDCHYIEDVFLEHHIQVYTGAGLLDITSILYDLERAISSGERKRLRVNSAAGRYRKIVQENVSIFKVPFGYQRDPKTRAVTVHPVESVTLAKLFAWSCETNVLAAAKRANAEKIPCQNMKKRTIHSVTRKKDPVWSRSMIIHMIENLEGYRTGVWEYTYKGHLVKYVWPPMPTLSDEIYIKLPIKLRERAVGKGSSLLTGLIQCAHSTPDDLHYIGLTHGTDARHQDAFAICKPCHCIRPREDLERLVWEACRVQMLRITEADKSSQGLADLEAELTSIQADLAVTSAESLRLGRAYIAGAIDEATHTALGVEITGRKRALELRQIKVKKALVGARSDQVTREEGLTRLLSRVKELWKLELTERSQDEVRKAIQELLQGGRILVDLGEKRRWRAETSPMVVTVPGIGHVDALVYSPEVRSLYLQKAILQISQIQLREAYPEILRENSSPASSG